jgi:EmrB/QacA subfamily drug resistance transporter
MGFWGAASGLAFIMGPILGGWLTQSGLGPALNSFLGVTDNWRFVFYVNVPFGVLTLLAALVVVPESRDEEARRRLDVVGVALASPAVFLLTYGFIEGARRGWLFPTRPLVILGTTVQPFGLSVVPFCFLLAAGLGAAFVLYERTRSVDPLMDLSLFRNRNYSVGLFTGVILNFGLMGATFILPLYCQAVLGIDPIHTGTLLLPFALALLVSSPVAGVLSERVGAKAVLVTGLVVLALSYLLIAHFRVDTSGSETMLPFVVMGVGMGLSMTPLTNMTLYGVPAEKSGGASGILSTMRQTGAVMGVAILSVVLQSTMAAAVGTHAREITGLPPAAQRVLVRYVQQGGVYGMPDDGPGGLAAQVGAALPFAGASGEAPALRPQEMAAAIDRAMKQGFTDGVNDTFRVAALIGAAAVLVSLLMTRIGSRRETEAPTIAPSEGYGPGAAAVSPPELDRQGTPAA